MVYVQTFVHTLDLYLISDRARQTSNLKVAGSSPALGVHNSLNFLGFFPKPGRSVLCASFFRLLASD